MDVSIRSTDTLNLSIKSRNFDLFALPVDDIDLVSHHVDKWEENRHIGEMCRLHRQVPQICRYFTFLSTGSEYMSIGRTNA